MTRCPQQQKVRIKKRSRSKQHNSHNCSGYARTRSSAAAAQRQHAADPEKFPAAREQQQPKQLFGLVQHDRSRIFFHFAY